MTHSADKEIYIGPPEQTGVISTKKIKLKLANIQTL